MDEVEFRNKMMADPSRTVAVQKVGRNEEKKYKKL